MILVSGISADQLISYVVVVHPYYLPVPIKLMYLKSMEDMMLPSPCGMIRARRVESLEYAFISRLSSKKQLVASQFMSCIG